MKRILNSFMIIAMTAMTLSSCQTKEIEPDFKGEEGDIHVIVKANGEVDYSNTKTEAVEGIDGTTYVKWLSTDKLDIWETPLGEDATKPKAFTSGVASNLRENGMQADFFVSFGGTVTGEEFWYTAIYPSGAVTKSSSGFYRYKMPAKQTLSADGNFSDDCDIMIGVPIQKSERVSDGSTLEYSFRRPGTVVKLRLKGIHSGETINSIKINAPEKITGFTKICIVPNEEYHIGEVYDFAYDEADNLPKNTLEIDGNGFVSDGDDDVWVRINACTWPEGSSLNITVDTDEAVYTKSYDNNLPKEYKFEEGGLTKFGFSFGVSDREEKSTATTYSLVKEAKDIVEGATYIFVGRNQSKSASEGAYYGFGALAGSIISPVQLVKITQSQSDPAPETIMVDNTTVVYTSTFESAGSGKYYMTYNGGYLKSGSKEISKVEKSSATSWSISIDNSIVTIGDGTYVISPNLGAQRFACYSAIQSANFPYLYVDLSTVKAQLAAPSVSAVEQELATAIKVTCSPVTKDMSGNTLDGAKLVYTLTVTGETEVAPITLSDEDLVEGQYVKTVSDLECGSYVVNVTVTDANDKYRSNYCEKDIALVQPELQALTISAVADAPARKITVSWTDVKDKDTESVAATSYQLYDGETPVGSAVCPGVQEAVISGENLEWGHEYHLSVVASLAGYVPSVSNTVNQTVAQPQLETPNIDVEGDADERTIYVLWDEISNATHYEVYNNAVLVETMAAGTHEYTFTEITYDVDYTITVKAVNRVNTNYLPATSEAAVVNVHNPATIGDFEVLTDVDTPNSVYVTWGEAENATSYDVTLYAGAEAVATETGVTGTEHTFSGVNAGNAYTVSVTAKADGKDDLVKYAEGTLTVRNATISYATVTGGSVSSDPQGSAKVGSVVTLSNTPSTGYEFKADSYTVNSEAIVGNTFEIAGDVTVAGTFQKINYTITKPGEYASNITIKKNGVAVDKANYGDLITIEAGSVSGKTFESWNVTGATPESTTANPTTFTMGTSNVTVTANYKVGAIDVLTNADFAATGTQYKDFSNVQKNTAKYAGNSARNNGIQLRTTNSNSGIVSTTSGGCIKSVTVKWNANCTSGRVLDVYVKNSAYASAADLYNSTNKGTKLGSITEGSTTTFTITGNYAYVGVRSNDGALNIDEIKFEWGEGGTPTPPTPTTYKLTLNQVAGGTISAEVEGQAVSSGAEIEKDKTVTITATPDANHEFDKWNVTGTIVGLSSTETFTMTGDVTVDATFKEKQGGGDPVYQDYTIVFKTAKDDGSTAISNTTKTSTVISEGTDYVTGFTSSCDKAYYSGKSGVKLGSTKGGGTLEFTLADTVKSKVKSIKIVSAKYGTESASITLYSGSTSLESGKTPGTDFTHTFNTPTNVSTIKLTSGSKRAYITSITIKVQTN